MARITDEMIENKIKTLNSMFGFKGRKLKRNKDGKLKITGSGFGLYQASGRMGLVFEKKGSTGEIDVSPMLNKPQLYDYISVMINSISYYKKRTKLK